MIGKGSPESVNTDFTFTLGCEIVSWCNISGKFLLILKMLLLMDYYVFYL